MLFLLNWQLTLVVAVFYVLMFLYVRFSGRRSKAYYKKQQDCLGELDEMCIRDRSCAGACFAPAQDYGSSRPRRPRVRIRWMLFGARK